MSSNPIEQLRLSMVAANVRQALADISVLDPAMRDSLAVVEATQHFQLGLQLLTRDGQPLAKPVNLIPSHN